MSRRNGHRSLFHVNRKRRLAIRAKKRALKVALLAKLKPEA